MELPEHDFLEPAIVAEHGEVFVDFGLVAGFLRLVHGLVAGGEEAAVQIEAVLPRADALAGLAGRGSLPLSFEEADWGERIGLGAGGCERDEHQDGLVHGITSLFYSPSAAIALTGTGGIFKYSLEYSEAGFQERTVRAVRDHRQGSRQRPAAGASGAAGPGRADRGGPGPVVRIVDCKCVAASQATARRAAGGGAEGWPIRSLSARRRGGVPPVAGPSRSRPFEDRRDRAGGPGLSGRSRIAAIHGSRGATKKYQGPERRRAGCSSPDRVRCRAHRGSPVDTG